MVLFFWFFLLVDGIIYSYVGKWLTRIDITIDIIMCLW